MLIYWKCCKCSNSVLKDSSIHFSIHPFDHPAFMLSSMYAKASCNAHNEHKNKHKLTCSLSASPPLLHILSFLFCSFWNIYRDQNGFNPLQLISLSPHGNNATCVFERQLCTFKTACRFDSVIVHGCIVPTEKLYCYKSN